MRTIVIGDIHGCYYELKTLLRNLKDSGKYDRQKDKLIFLGDYIDRGENSRLVVKLVRKMQKGNKNVIALMGNHEDMLINYINDTDVSWAYNGAKKTIESYDGFYKQFEDDINWMKSLPLYHKDKDFVYVHAGLDFKKPLSKQNRKTMLWTREEFIYDTTKYNKKVIYGHTPSFGVTGLSKPYSFNSNICIDTGCVFGGALTALIIENGEVKEFVQVEKGKY